MTHSGSAGSREKPRDVFVQFFSQEMLKNYGLVGKYKPARLAADLASVCKVALLIARGKLLIPTIDLVESPTLPIILQSMQSALDAELVNFIGSEVEPSGFLRHKQAHFSRTRLYPSYFHGVALPALERTADNWMKRAFSTTDDLTTRWKTSLADWAPSRDLITVPERLLGRILLKARAERKDRDISQQLWVLPERLDGEAFLWDVIATRGLLKPSGTIRQEVSLLLGYLWLESHVLEFDACILTDLPLLHRLDCFLSEAYPERVLSYSQLTATLRQLTLEEDIKLLPIEPLIGLRELETFRLFRDALWLKKHASKVAASPAIDELIFLERPLLDALARHASGLHRTSAPSTPEADSQHRLKILSEKLEIVANTLVGALCNSGHWIPSPRIRSLAMRSTVFLVHGWDTRKRNDLHLFLREELKLTVQVMASGPMGGRTLVEKFEDLATEASIAIVLITADETVVLPDGRHILRIRPNVLLEIGFFWGRLGRKHVILLIERPEEVELPSDLKGIGYIELTADLDRVKYPLIKELREAGVSVD
ncbi:MAG TPA: nucleotide-binding protein [Thermoanaerobaculia bacterium]|nr:nucleotide-binding protein [Thermoanaerobaculia bacterium]